jgi:hypothetical protein
LDGDALSRGATTSREFRSSIVPLEAAEREQRHAILRTADARQSALEICQGGREKKREEM